MGGEEGVGLLRGSGVFPVRGWRIGLASTDSALRRRAGSCHDRVSGTGLLSHVIERGLTACSCRKRERARGLGDRAVVTAAAAAGPGRWVGCRQAGARRGSAACGGSRWWRSSFPGAWRSRCKRWRIRRPPGGLRGLVHHPPQVRRALLGDVEVSPAQPASLRGLGKRLMSPISASITSAVNSPTPGSVVSTFTLWSALARAPEAA
jgi:hypothetical protein